MNSSRRSSLFAFAAVLGLALPMTGCYVEGEAFGEGHVEGESEVETHYAGAARTVSVAYQAGMDLHIASYYGAVRVIRGGNTDSVEVTFRPFIAGTAEAAAAAEARIEAELDMRVDADGEILVTSAREATASAEVGADIEVKLPASFSGDFEVEQVDGAVDVDLRGTSPSSTTVDTAGRGDVRVVGAAGAVAIATAVGNIDVDLASWTTERGHVHVSESGNIAVRVAADANGTLVVNAPAGTITEPAPMPESWTPDEECDATFGTYYLGATTGSILDVWTHSGSVTLMASAEVSARASIDLNLPE